MHQHGSEALERGEKKRAESFFLQTVRIGEKQGFEFSPNSADQLEQLYLEQRRYPEAENMFLKSKKITARDFPEDYRLQIQIELPLAAMYLQIGQVDKALFELKTAGNNWKTTKTRKDEPSSEISLKLAEQLSKLSITLVKNNRFADAESCAIILAPDKKSAIRIAKDTGVDLEIAKMRKFGTERGAKAWLGNETQKLGQEVADEFDQLGQSW